MQPEVIKVAISEAAPIEQFDFQVDPFRKAIAIPTIEVVENPVSPVGCAPKATAKINLGVRILWAIIGINQFARRTAVTVCVWNGFSPPKRSA